MDNTKFGDNICKEAVCIQTNQVYDSCRSKECLDDLRVYFPSSAQSIIERATSVKCRKAEVIWVFTDVEPLPFNRGYYTVDLKFYFKVTLDVFGCVGGTAKVCGLAMYNKRVALFGSEGKAKIFSSEYKEDNLDVQKLSKTNLPSAVVEVVDPVCLSARITDACDNSCNCCDLDDSTLPNCIHQIFDGGLVFGSEQKKVYVTLGLFTIVKLKRKTQLLIPVYDFCIPDKECVASNEKDPCELFCDLSFPVDEFFPPVKSDFPNDDKNTCGCE